MMSGRAAQLTTQQSEEQGYGGRITSHMYKCSLMCLRYQQLVANCFLTSRADICPLKNEAVKCS